MAGIPAPSNRVETLAGADEWRNRAGRLGSNPIAFAQIQQRRGSSSGRAAD